MYVVKELCIDGTPSTANKLVEHVVEDDYTPILSVLHRPGGNTVQKQGGPDDNTGQDLDVRFETCPHLVPL